jgi:hypothetical protein
MTKYHEERYEKDEEVRVVKKCEGDLIQETDYAVTPLVQS